MALVALCAGNSLAAERSLSRDEGIALALQRNEGIVIERESLSAAQSAVTEAKGAYDPLLQIEGGWERIHEPVNSSFSGAPPPQVGTIDEGLYANVSVQQLFASGGTATLRANNRRDTTDSTFAFLSPAYDTQLGVELRQPLLRNRGFDNARLILRVAESDREGASAALRRTISDTVATVERAYWTLAAARREVSVRAEAVRLAEEQATETRSRVEGGVAPETENAQPRAELERRRGELLTSREAASRADHALKSLILADIDDPLWAEELAPVEDLGVDPAPVDVPAALERALRTRPELEVATATLKSRRTETAAAENRVKPALDAVVSYDRFGFDSALGSSLQNLGNGDFADTRAGLLFAIPIGNRAAKANAARAQSFERQAEADLGRIRKTIRVEVQDAATALDTARARIEAARAANDAAEVQLSAERERYAVGFSTNFLVLTRQNDLSRTRLDLINAYADYQKARTEMARAQGSLLEERSIAIDRGEP